MTDEPNDRGTDEPPDPTFEDGSGEPPDSAFGQMPDLGGLLESAQQMMAQAQAAADEVVEGAAGGGLVKVEVDGHFDFRRIVIDPRAIDPDDPEILEDLVLAALRDAVGRVQASQQSALGIDLGAFGLDGGGLDGMLGSGDE